MKKFVAIAAVVAFSVSCSDPVAEKVEGSYAGPFSEVTIGNGTAVTSVTAIGDSKVNLSFAAPGFPNINVTGVSVSEPTLNNFGLAFSNDIYTFGGSVTDSVLTFVYTGDTIALSFTGNLQF